jgi:hypothetical protein
MFGSKHRRGGLCERSTSWWNEILETVRSNLILFEATKQSIFHFFSVPVVPDSSNRQINVLGQFRNLYFHGRCGHRRKEQSLAKSLYSSCSCSKISGNLLGSVKAQGSREMHLGADNKALVRN